METITIEVAQGKYDSSKEARAYGQIPMVYYAKGVEPLHFTTEYQDFRRAYNKAGKSTIMTMHDEKGGDYQVLVHEIQYDPISDLIIHVDLKAIKKGQKIQTDIPLVFTGESQAVREEGGVFNTLKDRVHIECLPNDLPHEIEVDISGIVDFHTTLTVGDIKVGEGIHILDALEIGIANVSAPRAAEPETTEVAEVAPAEGAEGEEKKDEGDSAE